ncbi:hypothetical protein CYPRO_1935 [Cyclonatronum proteinivorum]|uniref:Uncharacterized protein n=1 Tax=Cyclonatronum proteinivorum TaxID=1457365 RepID=A0A345UL33_9BACT|nr:hypothetical protein CYPRO_1935 [Cyclonatronum proteinivorum]
MRSCPPERSAAEPCQSSLPARHPERFSFGSSGISARQTGQARNCLRPHVRDLPSRSTPGKLVPEHCLNPERLCRSKVGDLSHDASNSFRVDLLFEASAGSVLFPAVRDDALGYHKKLKLQVISNHLIPQRNVFQTSVVLAPVAGFRFFGGPAFGILRDLKNCVTFTNPNKLSFRPWPSAIFADSSGSCCRSMTF